MPSTMIWGLVASSSLVVGALIAGVRRWGDRTIGIVLAFGAGALISGVSFELAEKGLARGGAVAVATGLALGAVAFFWADRAVERWAVRPGQAAAGVPLALGALLDGIPEQAVLGLGLAHGSEISYALLVAIFVSNLPEAIGSSAEMQETGRSRRFILGLWTAVAVACFAASLLGAAVAEVTSVQVEAGINGFAAGALLVMLVDSMIPEARQKASDVAGLATVVGFAVAAGISLMA